MAITLGTAQFNQPTAGTSLTFAYDCGTGSNRYLTVGFTAQDSGSGVTGVTYNGVSMSKLIGPIAYGLVAATNALYCYGLAAPATNSNNVVISSSSSISCFVYSLVLNGAIQTSTAVATASKVGDSLPNMSLPHSMTIDTTGTDGCAIIIHDGNDFGAPNYATDGDATQISNSGGETIAKLATTPQTTGASTTIRWRYSSSAGNWGALAVAISPVATAATQNSNYLMRRR